MPTVRLLSPADKELFLAMSREFYESDAVLHRIPEAFHQATFAELMRSAEYAEGFLLEQDGQACGYALLAKSFSREAGGIVIWIEELYLRPQARGKGLGGFFFDWLAENRPAARYRLEVEPENEGAVRLYGRKGFLPLPYGQMVREMQ